MDYKGSDGRMFLVVPPLKEHLLKAISTLEVVAPLKHGRWFIIIKGTVIPVQASHCHYRRNIQWCHHYK
jgi:hypothetical protein